MSAAPSTDTIVRAFAPADAPALAALWDRTLPDARPWSTGAAVIARKHAERDGLFWVAMRGGVVAGAVMAGYDGQRGWIYHLGVAPEHRRNGVGRALVRTAEAALGARGCPKVNLQILPANRDVVAFYERLGWAVEERISMGKTLVTSGVPPADASRRS